MKTVDFVKGRWAEIFAHYNMPPITGNKHYKGECPVCKSKGSIRIDDKDGSGSWICKCGSGNGWKLLTLATGKEWQTLAAEIDRVFGNDTSKDVKVEKKPDPGIAVRERFLSMPHLITSDVVEYMHSRGIYKIPRQGVRYSVGEYDDDAKRKVPCMFAIASNDFGEPIYTHVTYIENGQKAKVPVQKKMRTVREYDGSVAVKLSQPSAVLGIAEGIETALSAEIIYKVPTWSVLNAAIMRKFVAPVGTEALYIFADNDWSGTGLAAAFDCAKKNLLRAGGVGRVHVRWPKTVNDFNDLLMNGDEVCEWVMHRKEKVESDETYQMA